MENPAEFEDIIDDFDFDDEFLDDLGAEGLVLTQQEIEDYGVNHPSWKAFLEGKECENTYQKRVNDFILYHRQRIFEEQNMIANLIQYFIDNHAKKDEKGDPFYSPGTMRSWNSVFQAFFLHTQGVILKTAAPIIAAKLDQWEKEHEVKKARTFTKSELRKLFESIYELHCL